MNHQLATPATEVERLSSRRQLDQIHVGNRFRLMAGLSMLPEKLPRPVNERVEVRQNDVS